MKGKQSDLLSLDYWYLFENMSRHLKLQKLPYKDGSGDPMFDILFDQVLGE